MDPISFTLPQEALIYTKGSVFVEACPGAGKTQAIVERFIQRPNQVDRRGVGLLSFTNAAIDEARLRCGDHPDLLCVPNFVGTFDAFIGRFIVGPITRWRDGVWPSIVDSFERVPNTRFTAVRHSFDLSWFEFDSGGTATLKIENAPSEYRHVLRNLNSFEVGSANRDASLLFERLNKSGVIDCGSARALVRKFLDDDIYGGWVGRILQWRFCEIIVDEVQDCGPDEAHLLAFLLDSGIDLALVGDMEQSIFGFRGATPADVYTVASRLQQLPRMEHNFRSSPPICTINNSLRFDHCVDIPSGNFVDCLDHVQVLKYPGHGRAAEGIVAVGRKYGLDAGEIIVLAHAASAARECAGSQVAAQKATHSPLRRLARASVLVRSAGASVKVVSEAVDEVSAVVRGMALGTDRHSSEWAFAEARSLGFGAFRDGCLRLAFLIDPLSGPPSQFKKEVLNGLAMLGWSSWIDAPRLRIPNGDKWEDIVVSGEFLRWSTIHSFKGRQSPAVALVIPKSKSGVIAGNHHWMGGTADESRRVLYVGASRAQRLLILAVHQSEFDNVLSCLDRDKVPHEIFHH